MLDMEDDITPLPGPLILDGVKIDTLESLSNHIEANYQTLVPYFKKYCSDIKSVKSYFYDNPSVNIDVKDLGVLMKRGFDSDGIGFFYKLQTLSKELEPESESDLSPEERNTRLAVLQDSFRRYYIDPHHMASFSAQTLIGMMNTYETDYKSYVAPYTSLVTSSMMGKSRLMKEMSHHIPCLYMCLRRGDKSSGYPQRTPNIVEWIEAGLTTYRLRTEDFIADTENERPVLKFAAFLLSLLTHLNELALDVDNLANEFGIDVSNLGWLWHIFAPEPATTEMETFLHKFWKSVLTDADSTIEKYLGAGPKHKGNAENFLKGIYVTEMSRAYIDLQSTFLRWIPEAVPFTLILLFDEARSLCEISSYDGKHIIDDTFYNNDGSRRSDISVYETGYPFTNFRALKRALRFLLYCSRTVDKPFLRLFGLFTDTTSRLADFQPHPSMDRSARIYSEYAPGNKQFEPLYTFTSIDAHARVLCDGPCLSDAECVADPIRLIKFGRAGWYSMYNGRDNKNNQFYDIDKVTIVAGNKLLCMSGNSILDLRDQVQNAGTRLSPALSLKLFALLAVRLDIAAGPFTVEAGELVASHLAVLIDVNTDRSFLKTAYPSEPILAATAAEHIEVIGWGRPLMVLCNYIDSSVVQAGFRGELLTKVVCLIAMDEVIRALQPRKSPTPSPLVSWRYAKPVKVYQYLDHLLTSPNEYESFSSALIAQSASLKVNSEKLNQFLNGYIFFNHFNKSHVKMSMELMAKAWNRGAALMSKPYTESIDYFIPVVLAQPGTETHFGPMFDPWTRTQIDEASEHMSFILINSRNYHDNVDHEVAALSIVPKEANFQDTLSFEHKKNVYLSILQEFGASEINHSKVKKRVKLLFPKRGPEERQQIVVDLKGYDGETYNCLADLPLKDPNYQKRQLMQEAVKHLKERVEREDMRGDEDDLRHVTIKEGFYTSGNTKESWRNDWKIMKASIEHGDMMMSDATVTNQVKTGLHSLEEVLEDEGDRMDIE